MLILLRFFILGLVFSFGMASGHYSHGVVLPNQDTSEAPPVRAVPTGADTVGYGAQPPITFSLPSGQQARFQPTSQGWQAELAWGVRCQAPYRVLPVFAPPQVTVASRLAWLQRSTPHRLKTHLHVLDQSPQGPCIYLGRLGLLGGMPRNPVEWISGHHIDLNSEDECREVYDIPVGYRYRGYRIKPGSIVQRANCIIRYVEANSQEEIHRFVGTQGEHALEGNLTAEVPHVVTVGNIEGGVSRARVTRNRLTQRAHFRHAAVVVYGKTKRNKFLRRPSRVRMDIEIGLTEVVEDIPSPTPSVAQSSQPPQPSPDLPNEAQPSLVAQLEAATLANTAPTEDTLSTSSERTPTNYLVDEAQKPVVIEVVPHAEALEVADAEAEHEQARAIHARKQEDPMCALTTEERIQLLGMYIDEGVRNAQKLVGKEAVVVLGNTGAGKSTFLNYFMGCTMVEQDPEELGLVGLDDEVIVVLPRAQGGTLDEIMPIGHEKQSKTFLPHIEHDPRKAAPYAYCDCPGFLDNRWPEVNIANAVNIRRALQAASSVRLLILINYDTLKVDRGRGLSDMLKMCTQLFGSSKQLSLHRESVLLGITHVPVKKRMEKVRKFLLQDAPPVLASLTERMFFYDPLNEGGPDFSSLADCRSRVGALKPLKDAGKLFHTVLTDGDERMLRELAAQQCEALNTQLASHDYGTASTSWQLLQRLRIIDNLAVERLLQSSSTCVVEHITHLEIDYQRACHFYNFTKATRLLAHLTEIAQCFAHSATPLDLPDLEDLRSYLQACQQREQQAQLEREQRNQERLQAAEDKKQLLAIIDRQQKDTAAQLAHIRDEHARQKEALTQEMRSGKAQYEASIKKLESEHKALYTEKQEALSLVAKLDAASKRRLEEETKKLAEEYAARLEEARGTWSTTEAKYQAQLAEQHTQQLASEAKLQTEMDQLSRQKAVEAKQLASLRLPSEAFGAAQWKQYFGVEVVDSPSLPDGINDILNETAPFVLDNANGQQTVRASCMLTLIPRKVKLPSGKQVPFTLDQLGQLLLDNNKGYFNAFSENRNTKLGFNSHGYRYYSEYLTEANRTDPHPGSPCWVLVSKDVLKHTRSKTFDDQKKEVSKYAPLYGVPRVLEVATSVLGYYAAHDQARLYADSPLTYTRCQDLNKDGNPLRVGDFEAAGLDVNDSFHAHRIVNYYYVGMSCSRKF